MLWHGTATRISECVMLLSHGTATKGGLSCWYNPTDSFPWKWPYGHAHVTCMSRVLPCMHLPARVVLYDNGRPMWTTYRGKGKTISSGGTLVIGREQV
eukprot:1147856-Pelagomonas_calceolata.AAC.1